MKKVCFNCGHEFDYTSDDIQDNYWGRYLICPKCGGRVVWCNGGDVIYDFSSQYMATCPSCGYEDWESNFLRDKEQTVSFTAGQAEKRYQQIKGSGLCEPEGFLIM